MKRTLRAVSLGFALVLPASSAMAAGAGLYASYGHGWGEVREDDWDDVWDEGLPYHYDFDEDVFGVGFTFDTNVAQDRLFNYRLEIGYERVRQEWQHGNPTLSWDYDFPSNPPPASAFVRSKFVGNGFAMNHVFGFGVVRTDRMRMWMGPALRMNVDSYKDGALKIVEVDAGLGPQFGVNFHLGSTASLALSFGYQYLLVVHDWRLEPEYLYYAYDYIDSIGGEHKVFANLSILFRSPGDRFVSRARKK